MQKDKPAKHEAEDAKVLSDEAQQNQSKDGAARAADVEADVETEAATKPEETAEAEADVEAAPSEAEQASAAESDDGSRPETSKPEISAPESAGSTVSEKAAEEERDDAAELETPAPGAATASAHATEKASARGSENSGTASLLVAAVIGGVVGGGLAFVGSMLLGPGQGLSTSALDQRLAAVESRASAQLDALADRTSTIEETLATPSGNSEDPAAAEERRVLQRAQDQLAEANQALTQRIGVLEDAAIARQSSDADTLSTLREELNALSNAVAAGATAGDGEVRADVLEPRLNRLDKSLKRLEDRVTAVESGASLSKIERRLDTVEGKLAATEDRAAGNTAGMGDAATAVSNLEKRVAALESESQASIGGDAAAAVAFSVLSQAVAGSAPYADALHTVETVGKVEAAPALKEHAETGLPSIGALAARFDGASRDALAALARAEADEEGDVADAIGRRLSSFVTVRRTKESEGDDPAAVLSRAEARIDEGDATAALREIDALPQAAKSGMSAWIDDARVRADAEAALDELRKRLLTTQ